MKGVITGSETDYHRRIYAPVLVLAGCGFNNGGYSRGNA